MISKLSERVSVAPTRPEFLSWLGAGHSPKPRNRFGVGLFLNPIINFLPGFRLPALWRTILEIKTPEALWDDVIF